MKLRSVFLGLTLLVSAVRAADAQVPDQESTIRLTFAESVRLAEESAAPRAAAERVSAAGLSRDAASARRLPTIGLEAGMMGTTDPVGAFGTRLRQERFTQTDFALNALNSPDLIGDLSGTAGATWAIFDQGVGLDLRAAEADLEGAVASRARIVEASVLRVRLLYIDVLRASAALDASDAGIRAATELQSQIERRVEQGVAIEADRLRVRAELAGLQAAQAGAAAERDVAVEMLKAHLGLPPGQRVEIVDDLVAITNALSEGFGGVAQTSPTDRADILAARAGLSAAQARTEAIQGRRLPVLEAYTQIAAHSWSGDTGTSWTGGLRVSLPLFTGGAISRQAESATALNRAGEIELAQRVREAEAEVHQARLRLEAAQAALAASGAGVEAAGEAARLLASRFREGMTTLSEVLLADASLVQARRANVERQSALAEAFTHLLFVVGDAGPSNSNDLRNNR